ncbi:MAG: nucleotidyltransferase domain-containing protein [Planctomycetota bacterium]|nr:nucleotidyltransferase domain-containing protein [Planctomycetota bacterium]
MDKNAVLEIVARFQHALFARGVEPQKIVLFGSYATGNYREGSDIDLVVVSEDFNGKGYWERIELLSAAICDLWEPIEAVAMTPEEWEKGDSMIAQFAREGEEVYSA